MSTVYGETFEGKSRSRPPSTDHGSTQEAHNQTHDTEFASFLARYPALAEFQNFPEKSADKTVVDTLNRAFVAGFIPRSGMPEKINRTYFAMLLGYTGKITTKNSLTIFKAYDQLLPDFPRTATPELNPSARQVVELHPSLLTHQRYPEGSTAKKIVDILNLQIISGNVRRSRAFKISRKDIAQELGITKSAMTSYLAILNSYQRSLATDGDTLENRASMLRSWLRSQMEAGTLRLVAGKIHRRDVIEALGFPRTLAWSRYPALEAVIEEFDDLVAQTGYLPKKLKAELEWLEKRLDDDPPMSKTHCFKISGRALDAEMGYSTQTTNREPYASLIAEAERKLRLRIENDPLIALISGRPFKFRPFVESGWPESYILRLVEAFKVSYRTKESAESGYFLVKLVLEFLSDGNTQAAVEIFEGLATGFPLRLLEGPWTILSLEFRDTVIRSRFSYAKTANKHISVFNVMARKLAAQGVFPNLALPLQYLPEGGDSGHLRSVAEITVDSPKTVEPHHVDDYVRFAMSMLSNAARVRKIEFTPGETNDFNKVLRTELANERYVAVENPAAVILKVLERRLNSLKLAAEKIYVEAARMLRHGCDLLARASAPRNLIGSLEDLTDDAQTEIQERCFPSDDADRSLANLLDIIASKFSRLVPRSKSKNRLAVFLKKQITVFGGIPLVQQFLMPSPAAVSAVLTLYLIESGSNISVGRTLYEDCLETCEEPDQTKITGYKARARGKPIFAYLQNATSAVLSMNWLHEGWAFARKPTYRGEDKQYLFLACGREGVANLNEDSYRRHFREMAATVPELEGINVTPNMIRPSVLLKVALNGDGRTNVSRAIGQHSSQINKGYSGKFPTRLLYDNTIRDFLGFLETGVIQNVPEAHDALGVSSSDLETRLESLAKTGLGTLCINRNGRPGNEGAPCTSIDCWNGCPQLFLIARAEDVAVLRIWQASLREVEGEWVRDRPERWAEMWLPWLCFIDAIEMKMRQSFSSVWRAAGSLMQKIISHPNFRYMRPF